MFTKYIQALHSCSFNFVIYVHIFFVLFYCCSSKIVPFTIVSIDFKIFAPKLLVKKKNSQKCCRLIKFCCSIKHINLVFTFSLLKILKICRSHNFIRGLLSKSACQVLQQCPGHSPQAQLNHTRKHSKFYRNIIAGDILQRHQTQTFKNNK